MISGPPGSGKTSFLSALLSAAPIDHCIRACEEVRELHVPLVHGSYYEARPPALGGGGEITLRDLVKVTLAMRPDLIVVGEVRGAEALLHEVHCQRPGENHIGAAVRQRDHSFDAEALRRLLHPQIEEAVYTRTVPAATPHNPH